jgi:hypothetical protein
MGEATECRLLSTLRVQCTKAKWDKFVGFVMVSAVPSGQIATKLTISRFAAIAPRAWFCSVGVTKNPASGTS